MNYKKQMIKEYVERNEQEFQVLNKVYLDSVEKMRKIDLVSINKENVKKIIRPYLYRWGRMGRELGRKDWENDIVKRIRSKHKELAEFRTKKLSGVVVRKFQS